MGNFWLLIWWLWHTKTFRVANLQKAIASHTSNANWIGWAGDHVQQLQQLVNLIHKKYNEYLITRMYYLKPNSIFFLQLISEFFDTSLEAYFPIAHFGTKNVTMKEILPPIVADHADYKFKTWPKYNKSNSQLACVMIDCHNKPALLKLDRSCILHCCLFVEMSPSYNI